MSNPTGTNWCKYLRRQGNRYEVRPILKWDPTTRQDTRISLGQYYTPEAAAQAYRLWCRLLARIPDFYEARAEMRRQLNLPPMLPQNVRRHRSLFIVCVGPLGARRVLGPFPTEAKAAAAALRHSGHQSP